MLRQAQGEEVSPVNIAQIKKLKSFIQVPKANHRNTVGILLVRVRTPTGLKFCGTGTFWQVLESVSQGVLKSGEKLGINWNK